MTDMLDGLLISELTAVVDEAIVSFADCLAGQSPKAPLGVLFYGSLLRQCDPDGILDFYVITEDYRDFTGNAIIRLMNRVLPPNVRYAEMEHKGHLYRAKIATLSYKQFMARTRLKTLDTTIWARFCQPVRLVWVRDPHSADKILAAVRQCVVTASVWAALLGPERAPSEEYWHSLFSHTYKAELRVEKKGRSYNILRNQEARYTECLLGAWSAAGISVECRDGVLEPNIAEHIRRKARAQWRRIEKWGKPLNVIRLVKAAFTFENGLSYLLWKIERHTGQKLQVSEFEKKHPILGLPLILWHFRKLGF
ncbi:hypothetical protein PT277_05670 [Acetobacteraceae bacterium ESL0709]|nr:hypothetical protein [Acetobacteraceae bacterium ESL0697]MDF7678185.1 hypothetical protein [Acetobacteraceae bacterium ESL0709]